MVVYTKISKKDIKTSTLICCNNEEYNIKYVVDLISEILEITYQFPAISCELILLILHSVR